MWCTQRVVWEKLIFFFTFPPAKSFSYDARFKRKKLVECEANSHFFEKFTSNKIMKIISFSFEAQQEVMQEKPTMRQRKSHSKNNK
jgi:hypothetical protein